MTIFTVTAIVPWGEQAQAPYGSQYNEGDILPLASPVPLLAGTGDVRLADVVRGAPVAGGYLLEVGVDDNTKEGGKLLDDITAWRGEVGPYLMPHVRRQRLIHASTTILPTWSSAKLRVSPFGPTPAGAPTPSPIPPGPRVPSIGR